MEKYLSQTEIGKMTKKLGWGDQRKVAVLISRGKFPEPDAMIGKTKGWSKQTIYFWLKECKLVEGDNDEKFN